VAARHAAELGFALASDEGDELLILHVVVDNTNRYFLDARGEMFEKQLDIGRQMVEELCQLGQLQGVQTNASIQVGIDPETIILDVAQEHNIDLIILGTAVRPGSAPLFLGPRVERILRKTPCPVIIFNS
jgi:nucleotide-binding universal stress UspA family protein